MDFKNFSIVKTKNPRKAPSNFKREQKFNLKYQRFNKKIRNADKTVKEVGMHKITISKKVWNALQMEKNGFIQAYDETNNILILALVPQDQAVLFRGVSDSNKKGKSCKADLLEADLLKSGLVEELPYEDSVDQLLNLEEFTVNGAPDSWIKAFKIIKEVEPYTGLTITPLDESSVDGSSSQEADFENSNTKVQENSNDAETKSDEDTTEEEPQEEEEEEEEDFDFN